jgi:hypothetical protein
MAELDRHQWAGGMAVVSHGVRFGLRVDDPTLLARLPPYLPPRWRRTSSAVIDHLYSLETRRDGKKSGAYRLYAGSDVAVQAADLEIVLDDLRRRFDFQIATAAPSRVFVHAGVVEWRGRAIVIPGRSWSGKTTLVSALVRAGAGYYSDEFAVLDQRGRVHPYRRPLRLRDPRMQREPHVANAVGRRSLPLGVVVVTAYRPRARWRPGVLSRSQMLLALLQHTVMVRAQPAATLRILGRAVHDAQAIRGWRGEAAAVAAKLLDSGREESV